MRFGDEKPEPIIGPTPGPWRHVPGMVYEPGPSTHIASAGMEQGVYGPRPVLRGEEHFNGRLIAAAPELLEAARLGLELAEGWIHDQLDGTGSLESALLELLPIRAAIAKAEGE